MGAVSYRDKFLKWITAGLDMEMGVVFVRKGTEGTKVLYGSSNAGPCEITLNTVEFVPE